MCLYLDSQGSLIKTPFSFTLLFSPPVHLTFTFFGLFFFVPALCSNLREWLPFYKRPPVSSGTLTNVAPADSVHLSLVSLAIVIRTRFHLPVKVTTSPVLHLFLSYFSIFSPLILVCTVVRQHVLCFHLCILRVMLPLPRLF